MKHPILISSLIVFGEVCASSEVSLDLKGYVDPELNIERVDDNGTLDIFDRAESHYRITSNSEKNVDVKFSSRNGWKMKNKEDVNHVIPYEGEFIGKNCSEIVGENKESVKVDKSDFSDHEYEFSVIFRATDSIKNFAAGHYSDRITISVSAAE